MSSAWFKQFKSKHAPLIKVYPVMHPRQAPFDGFDPLQSLEIWLHPPFLTKKPGLHVWQEFP